MGRILLLGPSEWDPTRGRPPWDGTPMALRRQAATRLARHGLATLLMEDIPNENDEDILEKFRRLALHPETDAVLVIWPPRAKMQTTYDELLLLREWRRRSPTVWILHHVGTFHQSATDLHFMEPGGRSRYLDALGGMEVHAVSWTDPADLTRRLDQLGRNGLAPS